MIQSRRSRRRRRRRRYWLVLVLSDGVRVGLGLHVGVIG